MMIVRNIICFLFLGYSLASAQMEGNRSLLEDDMESGTDGWTADYPWALTTAFSRSGTHAWTDSPNGNYQNDQNLSLYLPPTDLTGFTSAALTFWHRFDFARGDQGTVWARLENGEWRGLKSFTGTQTTWVKTMVDLTPLVGRSIRLNFQLFSDGSETAEGWYIDDVAVSASYPHTPSSAVLENPQPNSFQSGIGVISGWACDAIVVGIAIDDDEYFDENFDGYITIEDQYLDTDMGLLEAAYGTSRADTMGVCGDTDNGFGALYNWNSLGDGTYTVQAFYWEVGPDGNFIQTLSAPATVTVTTLGHEFLRGVEREVSFTGFPSAGDEITLQWQQSLQNFVIRGTPGASGGHAGAQPRILENPQPGAFVSGIGAISGWVCDASTIEIEFDNDAANRWQAGYGTDRPDTYGVCGDTYNGFGLLYNWNNLGDGIHTVRALADGVEFASATIMVTTLGEEFLRGASGTFTVADFPQPGINVDLLWQQSQQNFVIAGVSGSGSEGVQTGFDALKAGKVREANNAFRQATLDDPTDTTAGLYHAVTRIATKALDSPQLRELARRSGMSLGGDTSDVCRADFPLPEEIPSGAPQMEGIFNALRNVLSPEIDAALATLNGLPASIEVPFVLGDLPPCLSMFANDFAVEIDRADVQVLIATLQAIQGMLEILAAYDVDVGLQALKTPTLQEILAAEPTTFPLVSSAPLSSARTFFDQALANASQAISSILAETDSQEDDVLVITPGDVADAQTIKRVLDLVRQSLRETTVLPTDIGLSDSERLNLSALFSGRIEALRPLLSAPGGTFSDPTFGGMAPDFTQQDIEAYTPENFLTWLVGE